MKTAKILVLNMVVQQMQAPNILDSTADERLIKKRGGEDNHHLCDQISHLYVFSTLAVFF